MHPTSLSPPCDFECELTLLMSLTQPTWKEEGLGPHGVVAPNWQLGWVSSWLSRTTDFLSDLYALVYSSETSPPPALER